MTNELRFEDLSLQDAFDVAILIEAEAADRYEELAGQLEVHRTPEAATFFRGMVAEEVRHRDDLLRRREALFGTSPTRIDQALVPEVEAADYDSVRAFMTVHAAVGVALAGEERARDFYALARDRARDPTIKKLFNDLHSEELVHVSRVAELQHALPPPEHVEPDAFADDPVAQ